MSIYTFYTSNPCGQTFDVNRRIIYSMRSIGQGYAGLEKFTTTMNLPSPVTKKNYNASVNVITKAVTEVAKKTMHDAAKEIVSSTASADIGVSTDGT